MGESQSRRILVLGALATVYFLAGRFGLSLAFINQSASAVWPPSGIAIAALLLLGASAWPAVTLGSFLVNLSTSGVVLASAAIAAGNTVEAVLAAWLTTRFARGRAAFDRAADIVRFTLAAVAATAVAATVGTASLIASGLAPPRDAGSVWLTWWLGDSAGAMLVPPLVLLWKRPAHVKWTLSVVLEAVVLVSCLVIVSLLVFGGASIAAGGYPLEFVVVPFLLWAAFRFGARETALSSAIVSVIAINGTLNGYGPFARSSPNESLLLLQAFVGTTATVMLAVAAEVFRRHAVERDIRSLNDTLEQVVAREKVARREAEDANQVKERFLATLSHELRTPLNAALGWTRMLTEAPYTQQFFERGLRAIHRNLVIQARLVADIIDVSRGATGGLDVERRPLDVTAIVHAAVDTVRDSGAARGITLRLHAPSGAVMTVGDSGRLQQVMWNLLENAVKFSGDGSSVDVTVTRADDVVEVAVADSGPGLDAAFLPYVFEEFRQADESMTRTHGGLGLGLAIARRIVQQHGGTIVAVNRAEGGALFTVRLPVATAGL